MRYGSVCSGIEAASVAWHPLGWTPAFFSEIDAFPCAALAHHYPTVPNYGDMTKFQEWPDADIDVLVGGTPCQSFSHAGLRKGLRDPRGNLMLTFGAIAARYRPCWLVWENVPGVLSTHDGRDFGSFLGMLAELGYGFAYRVLDAQFYGVAQRRRRVFVVGYLGDWHPAAAVLFDSASLRGDPAPRRAAGQGVAPTIAGCANGGGANGPGRDVDSCESLITGTLEASLGRSRGAGTPVPGLIPYDLRNVTSPGNRSNPAPGDPAGTMHRAPESMVIAMSSGQANAEVRDDGGAPTLTCLHEAPVVAMGFNWQNAGGYGNANDGLGITHEGTGPVLRKTHPAVAYSIMPMNSGKDFKARETDVAQPLMTQPVGGNQGGDYVVTSTVRRLTPRECERLQGFPDDYTLLPYRGKLAADAPRYKALGNSMAVPVMRWIGERIQMVEEVLCTTR